MIVSVDCSQAGLLPVSVTKHVFAGKAATCFVIRPGKLRVESRQKLAGRQRARHSEHVVDAVIELIRSITPARRTRDGG
jgi:hypothetical protein